MLYLDKVKIPVPVRFRKKNGESHVMKLPVFQMFPVSGIKIESCFDKNPFMLNGTSNPYYLDESISNLRVLGSKSK